MFGIALSVRSRVRECTPELFRQMVEAPQTGRTCAEIVDVWEAWKRGELTKEEFEEKKAELKRRLPIITPHAMFPSGHRRNEDAVPSGLSMYDIDHIANPRGYYEEHVAGRIGELGIELAHVTPSTEGLRLVFRMPEGMTLEEAQHWMSERLADENYDGCVKDLARCSFLVPRQYILYQGEGLFCHESPKVTNPDEREGLSQAPVASGTPEGCGRMPGEQEARLFKGIPYSDIIREYWRRTGGTPVEGERNVRLHKLAVNLRAICDNRKVLLMQIMPRLGLSEQEVQSIVESACKEGPKGISKTMASIIEDCKQKIENPDDDTPNAPSTVFHLQWKKLPIGLRESLVGVPGEMHLPVLCAIMPLAAAYADGVEVEYCDGQCHRLGLMSIIHGEQASGKSVCKSAVDVWKRQFDEEDRQARRREDEWKENRKRRKANEKAPEDPKVLIRMVPVTVSCSTLLKRFKNSGGHTLYSFGEELDTLRKTNGAGSWSSKYDIYRLSFDRGEWGQDYNSDQAESGVVNVAYNWTMLGTDGAMRKCFRQDNIENGLSSRVLVAEMPDASFQRMPKFGRRSAEDEARIQEAVTRLRSVTGLIDMPRLRRAIERWVEAKRVEAAKNIDRVMDVYRKRAAVIGFRCAVIFHLLENEKMGGGENEKMRESKAMLDFALLMAEYCLAEQMKAFGEALRNEYAETKDVCQRYGANHSVFDQLPPVFTMDDLRALKRGYCSDQSLRMIVSRWRHDNWIEKTDARHWRKSNNATM